VRFPPIFPKNTMLQIHFFFEVNTGLIIFYDGGSLKNYVTQETNPDRNYFDSAYSFCNPHLRLHDLYFK